VKVGHYRTATGSLPPLVWASTKAHMTNTVDIEAGGSQSGFTELGVDPELVAALGRLRSAPPTALQREMIPVLLAGKDCLVEAPSGAGKTNGYLLPIVQTVTPDAGLQALILQPTRSLASKLASNCARLASQRGLQVYSPDAGAGRAPRPHRLGHAAEIVITTPRGALPLLSREGVDASALRILVVDEADVIWNEGDRPTLERILEQLPESRQNVFVASQPGDELRELAQRVLREPVSIAAPAGMSRAEQAEQCWIETDGAARIETLIAFVRQGPPKLAVVFANDEAAAENVVAALRDARMNARPVSEPPRRDARGPRRPVSEVIVAVDPPPARLSTIAPTHVIHYQLPHDPRAYLRRMERCSRLRRGGCSVALVSADEQAQREAIEAAIGKPMHRLEAPQPSHGGRPRPDRRHADDRRPRDDRPRDGRARDSRPRSEKPPRRDAPQPQPAPAPAARLPEPFKPSSPEGKIVPERFLTVLRRDAALESAGIKPVPRTLGSRFPTERTFRMLRGRAKIQPVGEDEAD